MKQNEQVSKFQRFATQTINRSQLKGAPYNPRKISERNKRKLKKNLKEHGLVMPLVWNKRTGTLVSGHQRLAILDALEGTDDYNLTVAVIDVDEREERILNVQINNEFAMGEWDMDLLNEITADTSMNINLDDLGFGDELVMLFNGDDRFTDVYETRQYQADSDQLMKIKAMRKRSMEKLKNQQSAMFYFTVVCRDEQDREELMREIGYPPSEECVYSDAVRRLKGMTYE